MPRKVFTSEEMATNATITLDLASGKSGAEWTKMTLQVVDGTTAPVVGTITINAKVDKGAGAFQLIGSFDLTAKVPKYIEGSYEELQFIGASMTASSSAFIKVAAHSG